MAGYNEEIKKKEVEVFGVTYDRYVLIQLHKLFAARLHLKKIVEMPSHGAKAAGSLYSIGFGMAGCDVTLVNPEPEMMYGWKELDMDDKVETVFLPSGVYSSGFKDNSFNLAWNFVTWTELEYPDRYLLEMKRISDSYVLLVTCNNFQPGYPWHRLIHKIFRFPWTHGKVELNNISKVKNMFRHTGLKIIEYGAIDSPGWPDPSGPRDIRLHKKYGKKNEMETIKKPDWEVPIIQYAKSEKFPFWMRALGIWDMAFRKGVFKLPVSHLFYVLGKK